MNCVYFVNEDTGWVSGGRMAAVWYGTLYKSIDGGQNWSSVGQIGDDMSLIIDIFCQGNYGWLIGSSINSKKNYARTTDGGLTWTSEVLSHNMSKIFFLNENVGWIVGEGIIKTTDGGGSWTSLTSFCELPYVLTDLHFVSENVGWVIGQSGSILKTTNGGVTFVEEKKEKVIPSSLELEQNFPNPFNPSTKIRYSISQPSKVIIKIFDILGREIETLVNEEKPVGTYELTWNAVTLPSGVYFYQINAGEFIRTKKMLLIK
ncbi:MAG: YCF48-related protein [Ignavibacteriaceae bacterium]